MTHSPSIQTCTVKGVSPSLHSYIVLLCSALKMINFQTSVVQICCDSPQSLSPFHLAGKFGGSRSASCLSPWSWIGILESTAIIASLPVAMSNLTGSPERAPAKCKHWRILRECCQYDWDFHAFNLMMLCSLSDFQNFRGIKPQRPPATLAKACMQARSKCSNTTWFQKKASSQKGCPFLSLFCVWWCVKKLCISTLLYKSSLCCLPVPGVLRTHNNLFIITIHNNIACIFAILCMHQP